MAGALTSRYALPYPVGTDAPDVPYWMQNLAVKLDGIITTDGHGTLASRPAAGLSGRLYTDDATQITYRDTGSAWVALNPQAAIPVGAIEATLAASVNPPWLIMIGQSLVRTDYPDLFALIGTTWGSADSTHFTLPDMRGSTLVGSGTGTGLSARVLGDKGGAETVTISVAQLPSHAHQQGGQTDAQGNHSHGGATGTDSPDHAHTTNVGLWARTSGNFNTGTQNPFFFDSVGGYNSASGGASARHAHGITADGNHAHNLQGQTQAVGSGQATPNMQPFVVVNWMVRALP